MTVPCTVETIKVTRYRCSVCHKGFWKKKEAAAHHCYRDPQNRTCLSCRFDVDADNRRWQCEQGCRPEGVNVITDCPLWSPVRWIR